MKAIIVEDEQHSAAALVAMLELVSNQVEVTAITPSVEAAIAMIKEKEPDLVFLDVELSDGSGFDVLKAFRQLPFKTIFITSHEHYALRAIKHMPIDYLLKPLNPEELKSAVSKAQGLPPPHAYAGAIEKHSEERHTDHFGKEDTLIVTDGSNYRISSYQEVVYIVADEHYSSVHYADNTHLLSSDPLAQFEDKLPPSFLRVHRGYIVNLRHITSFNLKKNTSIELTNEAAVPLAHRRKKTFIQKLTELGLLK